MNTNKKNGDSHSVTMGRIGNRPMWVLQLSVVLRALHQVGAAIFLAVYLLDGLDGIPTPYLALVSVTGFCLIFTEWMRHRELYREVSGLCTMAKLILIGLAVHHILPQTASVTAAFLIASISAHAPRQFRHRLIFKR